MATMLEVKNLKKRFGSFEAVKGISFSVAKGEVLGFLGPNGAGKSTTMRMITRRQTVRLSYAGTTYRQILSRRRNA